MSTPIPFLILAPVCCQSLWLAAALDRLPGVAVVEDFKLLATPDLPGQPPPGAPGAATVIDDPAVDLAGRLLAAAAAATRRRGAAVTAIGGRLTLDLEPVSIAPARALLERLDLSGVRVLGLIRPVPDILADFLRRLVRWETYAIDPDALTGREAPWLSARLHALAALPLQDRIGAVPAGLGRRFAANADAAAMIVRAIAADRGHLLAGPALPDRVADAAIRLDRPAAMPPHLPIAALPPLRPGMFLVDAGVGP